MFKNTSTPIKATLAAAKSKYVKKQSKIIPFDTQIIHNYSEIGLKTQIATAEQTIAQFNENKINVLTRISKIDTKNHKFPRIIKEYDIILGNKVLTIKDMFTSIPSTINDEITSMMQQSVVNTSDAYGISFKLDNLANNFNCKQQPLTQIDDCTRYRSCCSCCGLEAKQNIDQTAQQYIDIEDQTTDDDDTATTTNTSTQSCVFRCEGIRQTKESSTQNVVVDSSRSLSNDSEYLRLPQYSWQQPEQPQLYQQQLQQLPSPSLPSLPPKQLPLYHHHEVLLNNNNNNNLGLACNNNSLLLQKKLMQQQQQMQVVMQQQQAPVVELTTIQTEIGGGADIQGGEDEEAAGGEESGKGGKIISSSNFESFKSKRTFKPFNVLKKQIRKVPSRKVVSSLAQSQTKRVEQTVMVDEKV